jgi:hypothetical protein
MSAKKQRGSPLRFDGARVRHFIGPAQTVYPTVREGEP